MTAVATQPEATISSGDAEAPAGYKRTALGLIPKQWDVRTLGEIGECIIGLTYDPSNVRSDGLLVLRSSNIQDDRLSFDDNVYVDVQVPDRLIVREHDLLICVRNGSRPLIGKCVLIDSRAAGMTFGAFMSVFRSPSNEFVAHCFKSDAVKRQIHEHLGATINQITNKSLKSFLIPFPEPRERQLISQTLGHVDELIVALEKLIAKKRAIKRAAMQQLLTGKTRLPGFKGEWTECRLADLGPFSKGRGIKRDEVSDEGVRCVRYGEIYTRYNDYVMTPVTQIPASVAARALAIKKGDLLFAASGETAEEIGKCVAYLGEDVAYAGGDIVVHTPSEHDSLYLGHLLNHETIAQQKARFGQGDAVVHISATNLGRLELHLPPHDEQQAIARVLADMDAEITALEARRDKTKALKRGTMKELLSGRVRLIAAGAAT